jgi:hypothetical protein
MHPAPSKPSIPTEETLPPEWLEALRTLHSEQGGTSAKTDDAVLATARETLAAIRRRKLRQRLWPVLAAAACVLFALVLFFKPRATPDPSVAAPAEDKYALILREVSALFPQQIKAIISDGSDLQISLADQPYSDNGPAVVIEICEKGGCKTVITYVGRTFEIGNHLVTVRTDEKGGIVVDSPDAGLQITTRRI